MGLMSFMWADSCDLFGEESSGMSMSDIRSMFSLFFLGKYLRFNVDS